MIQKRIEVVVMNDKHPLARILAVEFAQVASDLQSHRRLTGPALAKHYRCGRLARIPIHLVPTRMVRAGDAVVLEDRIGLGVLLREGIANDTVVFQKLLDLHLRSLSVGRRSPCHKGSWVPGSWVPGGATIGLGMVGVRGQREPGCRDRQPNRAYYSWRSLPTCPSGVRTERNGKTSPVRLRVREPVLETVLVRVLGLWPGRKSLGLCQCPNRSFRRGDSVENRSYERLCVRHSSGIQFNGTEEGCGNVD